MLGNTCNSEDVRRDPSLTIFSPESGEADAADLDLEDHAARRTLSPKPLQVEGLSRGSAFLKVGRWSAPTKDTYVQQPDRPTAPPPHQQPASDFSSDGERTTIYLREFVLLRAVSVHWCLSTALVERTLYCHPEFSETSFCFAVSAAIG